MSSSDFNQFITGILTAGAVFAIFVVLAIAMIGLIIYFVVRGLRRLKKQDDNEETISENPDKP